MTAVPDDPFPAPERRLLERLVAVWTEGHGDLHLLPATGPSRAGFATNESHSLVVAERQRFGVAWTRGRLMAEEDDVIVAPRDRAYRHLWDERRRRYPALVIAPFDDDLVLHRRNAAPERWPAVTWRCAGGTGRAFAAALEQVVVLREAPAADATWADAAVRRAVTTALAIAVAATDAPRRASRGGPAVAVRCRNYLRHALGDPALDVPTVAAALGYDARSLGQEYRRETGETLRETLCLMRVQRARELLRRRDLPIAEIASLCGFASPSHFSRTFKRIEGHPPRKYRSYGHLEEEG